MQFLIIFYLLFTLIQSIFGAGDLQSVAVHGILKCGDKLAAGVRVKLYDVDSECDRVLIKKKN